MLYTEKERQRYSGFVISKHSYKLERVGGILFAQSLVFVCLFLCLFMRRVTKLQLC